MTKFITVFAYAMIAVGVLSFVGAGLNYMMMESLTTSENEAECGAWIVSCWTYGWGFILGGSVLILLEEIRQLLAAPLDITE